jgi:hypothetical protein
MHLKIQQVDDCGSKVKLLIDMDDDGASDYIVVFARFMIAAGFNVDAIATAMTAWCIENGEDGQP